jgi:hypothetical protein
LAKEGPPGFWRFIERQRPIKSFGSGFRLFLHLPNFLLFGLVVFGDEARAFGVIAGVYRLMMRFFVDIKSKHGKEVRGSEDDNDYLYPAHMSLGESLLLFAAFLLVVEVSKEQTSGNERDSDRKGPGVSDADVGETADDIGSTKPEKDGPDVVLPSA